MRPRDKRLNTPVPARVFSRSPAFAMRESARFTMGVSTFGSLNTSLALTCGDPVAVTLGFDALRYEESDTPPTWSWEYFVPKEAEGGTHSAWHARARFGGWLGPVATGALLGVSMIAFAGDPM